MKFKIPLTIPSSGFLDFPIRVDGESSILYESSYISESNETLSAGVFFSPIIENDNGDVEIVTLLAVDLVVQAWKGSVIGPTQGVITFRFENSSVWFNLDLTFEVEFQELVNGSSLRNAFVMQTKEKNRIEGLLSKTMANVTEGNPDNETVYSVPAEAPRQALTRATSTSGLANRSKPSGIFNMFFFCNIFFAHLNFKFLPPFSYLDDVSCNTRVSMPTEILLLKKAIDDYSTSLAGSIAGRRDTELDASNVSNNVNLEDNVQLLKKKLEDIRSQLAS